MNEWTTASLTRLHVDELVRDAAHRRDARAVRATHARRAARRRLAGRLRTSEAAPAH